MHPAKLAGMVLEVIVIACGCFAASAVNAAFATGGVHITLAASSAVLPLSAAIPMQVALNATSLLARIYTFWRQIHWPVFVMFAPAAALGVIAGAQVFVSLDEGVIALCLGWLLLALVWLVPDGINLKAPRRFRLVGILHGFFSTIFGVGLFLQPAILRTELGRLQITGTLAACLMALELVKAGGYVGFGFSYASYWPHIMAGALSSLVGNLVGHRLGRYVSEDRFRLVFKLLVTFVGIRLILKGGLSLAGLGGGWFWGALL
ncbi:MAG: TSUP family transporter [Candidatus Puniceispirillaceae bacterium]